ncbi:MAG TPA: hypothetical protein VGJ18_04340 [Gemmatimonadaceae bacterium]|jgi:hypothetical protein
MKALFAALLLLVGACASVMHTSEETPAVSLLTVHNQRSEDETIWVMHDGYKGRRLGTVSGLNSATFVLTQLDVPLQATVQFLAASFKRDGHSVLSDPVVVQRGATYDWKLFATPGHEVITASYHSTH